MNPAALYKDNQILTASKGQIVVLLYEGAVRFMNLALKAIEKNDFEAKSNYINRSLEIVLELNMNLDMHQGGQISKNLRTLYNYMFISLKEANSTLDTQKISHLINLISNLHHGFKSIAS